MDDVIADFNERVNQIDVYLKLLSDLSAPDSKITIMGRRSKKIDVVALKTMKATCFLLLYNLVESSIRSSMAKIYEKMNDEGCDLTGFDPVVKTIWLEQQFKDMKPFSANQTTYRELVKKIVDHVLNSRPVELNADKIPISGNLDARSIRELFGQHKISTITHHRAFNGAELKTIKDKRNLLAHGNVSFADCGNEYTVSDLISIKKQAVIYLKSSLKNIEKYIEKSIYAA